MTPHNVYIDILLDAISNEPFPSEDQREMLLTIKGHLAAVPDLGEELKRLYKVEHFTEFAIALMWIQQQVDLDPGRSEPAPDDQYLVSMKFRQAFSGGSSESEPSQSVVEEEPAAAEPARQDPPQVPGAEERPPVAYDPDAPEETFPQLLDKFVIAAQAGVDDKIKLLEKVMSAAAEIGQPESDYSSDLQEFCSTLLEFLSYAKRNEYMDDVRTMNILSTISDVASSWSSASIEARSGLLSDGIRALTDAQSHYE